MPVEAAFGLVQFNAVAAPLHHAVTPSDIYESIVAILLHNVASVVPERSVALKKCGRTLLGPIPVSRKHRLAGDIKQTFFSGGHRRSIGVHDQSGAVRTRPTNRIRFCPLFRNRRRNPREGANIGFQLGGQATDFVLLVMNPRGANSILSSKVKLGADASAAIGPKGRTAAADTDIVMRAEVLSYSRARGLFAGVSLEGSTLRSDGSANRKLYGRSLTAKEIVREGKAGVPASGRELVSLLNKQSPKNESDPVSLRE